MYDRAEFCSILNKQQNCENTSSILRRWCFNKLSSPEHCFIFLRYGVQKQMSIRFAQKSINWTIFIQLLRQHLRYDCDYKN